MKLKANSRDIIGKKVSQLREKGVIPASVYGPSRESTNISVSPKEFKKAFKSVGYSSIFDLELDGKVTKVLVKEVQANVLTDAYLHISFYEVDMNKTITAEVPVLLEGESPAVKNNIGLLINPFSSVMLSCLPGDLPANLTLTVDGLEEIGAILRLSDLTLPKGVDLAPGVMANTTVAYIAAPQKAVEITETEEGEETENEETEGEAEAEPAA